MTAKLSFDSRPPYDLLRHCPLHAATPLRPMDALAAECGWKGLMAKDESARMGAAPSGMGSFKALGGAYAIAEHLLHAFGGEPAALTSEIARTHASGVTFACASAGNHGLSVAAGARVFGARAVVYLAETVPEAFAERLRGKGAEVIRSGAVYEDAMKTAMDDAVANGWHLVSDSSWTGYTDVPATIMRGYAVMAEEARAACEGGNRWPSHVFLQAGVGGFAAAMAGHIRDHWSVQPRIVIVEPDRAPCLRASVAAGEPIRADGPESNMGRLDCKEPSILAFDILTRCADAFETVTDEEAEAGVERLARHGIATTPSGAAGLAGAVASALPPEAIPLVFVTEGTA